MQTKYGFYWRVIAVVAATYFIAHTALTPARQSFLDYRLLKNQNYVTGLLFIFIVGLVLYATRALTPTMLENLLGYPVATTGLVTAPAGLGTMVAMLIAGRIIGKVDLRLTLLAGFCATAGRAHSQRSNAACFLTSRSNSGGCNAPTLPPACRKINIPVGG